MFQIGIKSLLSLFYISVLYYSTVSQLKFKSLNTYWVLSLYPKVYWFVRKFLSFVVYMKSLKTWKKLIKI
jgi:hypothetical protein